MKTSGRESHIIVISLASRRDIQKPDLGRKVYFPHVNPFRTGYHFLY